MKAILMILSLVVFGVPAYAQKGQASVSIDTASVRITSDSTVLVSYTWKFDEVQRSDTVYQGIFTGVEVDCKRNTIKTWVQVYYGPDGKLIKKLEYSDPKWVEPAPNTIAPQMIKGACAAAKKWGRPSK